MFSMTDRRPVRKKEIRNVKMSVYRINIFYET